MKAILFDRDIKDLISQPLALTLISDSAITVAGRPVFLPDFDSEWSAEFYLAMKVCRLGKCIPEKFAHRYYDRFTLAMRLVPTNITAELRSQGLPTAIGDLFDNALTLGQWVEATEIQDCFTATVCEKTITIDSLRDLTDKAVSSISRYTTLKTGDVVMLGRLTDNIRAEQGIQILATINSQECLSLKIH